MSRKTAEVVIAAEGRDKGKRFLITEMPALKAERWAMRAINAIGKAGVEIPDGAESLGMAGLAGVALRSIITVDFEDAEPLLDEMMRCVQRKMDSGVIRDLNEDDVEEVATLLQLRGEVIALHVGFSLADVTSRLRSGPASALPTSNSSEAPTSPPTSRPSSKPASRR